MISISEVSSSEYFEIVKSPVIIFNDVQFLKLNSSKVDEVKYLILSKGNSARFSLVLGVRNGIGESPFSAPFSLLEPLKKESTLENYDDALDAIYQYASQHGLKKIKITLPPIFYNESYLTGWLNSMWRKGWCCKIIDINYAFNLCSLGDNYDLYLAHNAKKNLRIANSLNLKLQICGNDDEINKAYNIIAENRASKGYPLRMTRIQVFDTIKIIPHDVFFVKQGEDLIAAAFVYRVSDGIAQVIYWGDKPGNGKAKPINFLASELIKYYRDKGFKWLDIGPSTEGGIPNYGLCEFKESIGCVRNLKFSVELMIRE